MRRNSIVEFIKSNRNSLDLIMDSILNGSHGEKEINEMEEK